MILAFSAKKNFLDLTKIDERNQALKILYGIKTFSILLIIMDHRFGTFVSSAIFNFDYVEKVCIIVWKTQHSLKHPDHK